MASQSQTALLVLERPDASDRRLVAALDKTRSLLTSGEQIAHAAVQLRLHALFHRRLLLVATDRRVIVLRRRLFGGFDMQDIAWQDVREARAQEHVFPHWLGADLVITAHDGRSCSITGADACAARARRAFAQGQEQAWREKHRVRRMEELRAEAGGISCGCGPQRRAAGESRRSAREAARSARAAR